ncbi:Putative 3-hydroxyisobutyrate dehydrogenase, mitochondrial [Fusarium odoratissimum]|uniref:Putative 3-hydroxyisobutyrate dehydrogenase, mitochondrial n=1 Tax=Fusarium oxysporum f. sp. cubense (strain race 4) TaxID=2502994 RepID=N1RMA2_FUSC4|nr:Putative 3-hydroxyisobutyrate dehydrogenase, mitochondrial [Fusarium odoratissimum]
MATDFGVIGLGIIGYGIASNLRKKIPASSTLHVLDLDQAIIQRQIAKIAHNYITLANNLVATEGMAIGLKYGIDKKALFKCIREGTANSWVMGLEQPVPGLVPEAPSSNKYKRAFAPALSVKDLTIGIEAAKKVGIAPTAGEAAIKAFREVDADPRTHDLDHTSLWLHVYGNLDEWAQENL